CRRSMPHKTASIGKTMHRLFERIFLVVNFALAQESVEGGTSSIDSGSQPGPQAGKLLLVRLPSVGFPLQSPGVPPSSPPVAPPSLLY
ncbi:MAG: hypothetical protein KDC06_12385, partial [Chitinophagaceae bacterium]|nr:hypothetical protein [Chitinophagaceae bacterium]